MEKTKNFLLHPITSIAILLFVLFGMLPTLSYLTTRWYLWKGKIDLMMLSGYTRQGTMPAWNTTLRVPNGISPEAYCRTLKVSPNSNAGTVISFVGHEETPYCGACIQNNNKPIEYRLFKDHIVYRCFDSLITTTRLPKNMG